MKRTAAQARTGTKTSTTTTTTTTKRKPNSPRSTKGSGAARSKDDRPEKRPAAPTTTGARRDKSPADHPSYSSVNLRVHEIRCISTTKEIDKDEIVISAVKVEGAVGGTKERQQLVARAQKGEQISAGKFAKGDKQTYPKTRVLANYEAGGRIGQDPRFYLGVLVLIEEDEGKIGEVINSAVKAVDKEVVTAISTAAGAATAAALAGAGTGAAIGSAVPLLGTVIGVAVGTAVGFAVSEIKAARADDVFPLKKIELQLTRFPDEPGEIAGSRQTVTFKGFKGHYEVIVSWAVR